VNIISSKPCKACTFVAILLLKTAIISACHSVSIKDIVEKFGRYLFACGSIYIDGLQILFRAE
jgi:hypothetical protein